MSKCCICFEPINKKTKKQKCNICLDTLVCIKCFNFMKESNLQDNCPVCRSVNWYTKENVSFVIVLNTSTDTVTNNSICNNQIICIKKCHNKIKIFIICCCKLILYIVVIWSIGFILISLLNRDFYQYIHHPTAIFLTFITGLVFILVSTITYQKCKNAD